MRRMIPAFMGLALALGTVGGIRAADDKYKEKTKETVQPDGDMKVKSKVKQGKHKSKSETKIDQKDNGDVNVKTKTKEK